ncbi:MAG: diacylglycerol kinase family protein [Oscillospiraceae bacterium]|nr:diacylglycerol kinase family protein [Oscillospiraceae bacterium]
MAWLKHLTNSFLWAGRGFFLAVRRERNMRIHLTAIFYVTIAGLLSGLSRQDWAILVLCFGMVPAAELINTALEEACNAITEERNNKICAAKDVAAAGVLFTALASAGVAVCIFGRKAVWSHIASLLAARPFLAAALALTLPLALLWIKGRTEK